MIHYREYIISCSPVENYGFYGAGKFRFSTLTTIKDGEIHNIKLLQLHFLKCITLLSGHRLPNSSSSTYCELHGLLEAITLLTRKRKNGLIICDSQSALPAISCPRPAHQHLVKQILRQLATAHKNSLVVYFHIGLIANNTTDLLAKTAYVLTPPAAGVTTVFLLYYKNMIRQAARTSTLHRRNFERAHSATIQHYDHFLAHPHKYRRSGLMVRRHNVVYARLKLGYRPVWQVDETGQASLFCLHKLCDTPNAKTLEQVLNIA